MSRQENDVKKNVQPKVWMGIVWFLVVMLVLFFGASLIQYALGMWGVAITEIILLLMGIIPALVLGWKLKEVIPIRRPKLHQVFGTLMIWAGTYLVVIASTMVIGYFFPEELFSVSSGMGDIFTSIPPLAAFVIIAIMPAICEEILHRGLIQYTFKNVKKKWVIVLSMGIIFGVFHLDPIRAVPTGLLGAALTYVMLETGNILLPMLLHFTNNALSAITSLSGAGTNLDTDTVEAAANQMSSSTMMLGVYCILAVAAPILLLLGAALLKGNRNNSRVPENDVQDVLSENERTIPNDKFLTGKKIVIALTCSAALFISGIALVINGMKDVDWQELSQISGMEYQFDQIWKDKGEQFNISETKTVTENAVSEYKVEILQDGNYEIKFEMTGKNENCRCGVVLLDASGKMVYYSGEAGISLTTQAYVELNQGSYTLRYTYTCPAGNEDTFQVNTVVK